MNKLQLTLIKKDDPVKQYTLDIMHDESLSNIVNKLNTYRSPDKQINELYNQYNQVIPLSYKVKRNMTFYF